MKTIRLTPQQRTDIGERRRHAPDRRIYQRLSAALWSDDGRSREEIPDLLGVSTRQVGQWLRTFRNKGLDQLCTLHYQGDPLSRLSGSYRRAAGSTLYLALPAVLSGILCLPGVCHGVRLPVADQSSVS